MVGPQLFQALADTTRLKILRLLSDGPMNVSSMVKRLGCLQPAVSRHLKVLRDASLIRGRRKGKEVEYAISPDVITEAISYLESLVCKSGLGSPRRADSQGASTKAKSRHPRRASKVEPSAEPPAEEQFEFERRQDVMDDFLL